MPHRKLVRIGEPPQLPTISQFLTEMAARQHEEIQRLKTEALSGTLPDPTVPEEHHEALTPDPWQLHPVRIKKATKRRATKKKTAARKSSGSKTARPKKAVKKALKPKSTRPPKKAVRRKKK